MEEYAFSFGESELGYDDVGILPRTDVDEWEKEFIPEWRSSYVIPESLWAKIVSSVVVDEPVMLVGERGGGKTTAVKMLASALGQPLRVMSMTSQTRTRDILGYRTLKEGEIEWVDGVVTSAIRHGHWLLIDEFASAPPGVLMALQSVLEDERTIYLAENGGEVVRPPISTSNFAPGDDAVAVDKAPSTTRIFATSNTLGYGTDMGLYAGSKVMNAATMDRFEFIPVGSYEDEMVIDILLSHSGLSECICTRLVNFRNKIEEEVVNGPMLVGVSIRQLVKTASKAAYLFNRWKRSQSSPKDEADVWKLAVNVAFDMCIPSRMPMEDRATVKAIWSRETNW